MEFFPVEKIIFASDCPFDPEGGTMYPRETLRILEVAQSSEGHTGRDLFPEPGADHRQEAGQVAVS